MSFIHTHSKSRGSSILDKILLNVCQLRGVQVNTSKNQADAFFTEDARFGEQKAVLGTNSRKQRQFLANNRELGSTQGRRTPVLLRAFPSRKGSSGGRSWLGVSEMN